MEYPANRSEAKATGATHYFTGKPCIRGHVAPRLTKGVCTVCREEDWQRDNDRRKGKPKTAASKAAGRRYYLRNKELVKTRAAARPAEEKQRHRRKHKERNPEVYKVLTNARRRRLREASPPWLTAKQKQQIRIMYQTALDLSEAMQERYEVDHIVPINSELVCGLHVPWNLQVMTKEDNLRKSNSV